MLAEDESRSVRWGKTQIDYSIRRSSRRKTVAVAVDPVEGVMLTAPTDVSLTKLDDVVQEKAKWIVDRLRLVEQVTPAKPKRFVSGEEFMYLGRRFKLKIVRRVHAARARLERGLLTVTIPRSSSSQDRAGVVRGALEDWYRGRARQKIEERVEAWAPEVGVPVPKVLIRSQTKRWASCDDRGVLRFNWRLIQAPMKLVDYVVVHELVHLVHRDHGKMFWGRVGEVMPDYENRATLLAKRAPLFLWK